MLTRHPRRRFQPMIETMPLRLAPALFGAIPVADFETTTVPDDPPPADSPQASSDLLTTSVPEHSC